MKKIIYFIASLLAKNYYLFKLSEKVVFYYKNENNAEFKTNGERDFLKKNLKGYETIFDVGANIGDWSLMVNKENPNAKIYSFEPFINSFEILKNRKYVNNNVSPFNIALEKISEKKIFLFIKGSLFSILYTIEK